MVTAELKRKPKSHPQSPWFYKGGLVFLRFRQERVCEQMTGTAVATVASHFTPYSHTVTVCLLTPEFCWRPHLVVNDGHRMLLPRRVLEKAAMMNSGLTEQADLW